MRKLIAAMNMTLDGFCNHTYGIADDELHEHYNDVLRNAGALLYGRTTYELMESYWPAVVANPTGNRATDEFAVLIDDISKIVFSRSLQGVTWQNSTLKNELVKDEILELKQQTGKDIYVGSPSMIVALTRLNLVDEFQLCVHPVIAGNGLPLFKEIGRYIELKLLKTKHFDSGVVAHYYKPEIDV